MRKEEAHSKARDPIEFRESLLLMTDAICWNSKRTVDLLESLLGYAKSFRTEGRVNGSNPAVSEALEQAIEKNIHRISDAN